MDELKNNPQIVELLETLEENGMHKEKGEGDFVNKLNKK